MNKIDDSSIIQRVESLLMVRPSLSRGRAIELALDGICRPEDVPSNKRRIEMKFRSIRFEEIILMHQKRYTIEIMKSGSELLFILNLPVCEIFAVETVVTIIVSEGMISYQINEKKEDKKSLKNIPIEMILDILGIRFVEDGRVVTEKRMTSKLYDIYAKSIYEMWSAEGFSNEDCNKNGSFRQALDIETKRVNENGLRMILSTLNNENFKMMNFLCNNSQEERMLGYLLNKSKQVFLYSIASFISPYMFIMTDKELKTWNGRQIDFLYYYLKDVMQPSLSDSGKFDYDDAVWLWGLLGNRSIMPLNVEELRLLIELKPFISMDLIEGDEDVAALLDFCLEVSRIDKRNKSSFFINIEVMNTDRIRYKDIKNIFIEYDGDIKNGIILLTTDFEIVLNQIMKLIKNIYLNEIKKRDKYIKNNICIKLKNIKNDFMLYTLSRNLLIDGRNLYEIFDSIKKFKNENLKESEFDDLDKTWRKCSSFFVSRWKFDGLKSLEAIFAANIEENVLEYENEEKKRGFFDFLKEKLRSNKK